MLLPTPRDRLLDARGRPYYLWDCALTLDELEERLDSEDDEVRAYWLGKVMRQARPDDALALVSVQEMQRLWARLEPYLGKSRDMWAWLLLDRWAAT